MKKKIVGVVLALTVFVTGVSINTKAESLKLSESNIEFYPSERHIIVVSSVSSLDKNQLQIKSKDVDVKNEGCEQTDVDHACLLSFSGFKPTNEKVEIKYNDQVFYVNTKVKSLDSSKQNMSLDEQYEIALAKLLTKYHVVSTDDIKDEKVREDVENQIEKLKNDYTDPKDKTEVKDSDEVRDKETYAKKRTPSPDVGLVLLTKNAQTSGIIYGHAGIKGKYDDDVIETRGPFTGGVKVYPEAIKKWKKYPAKTGIWNVNRTTLAKRQKAEAWAEKQHGKEYALIEPGDMFFFCTKLVWRSWESQKVKIGHFWFATDMMTKSKALTVKQLYHK